MNADKQEGIKGLEAGGRAWICATLRAYAGLGVGCLKREASAPNAPRIAPKMGAVSKWSPPALRVCWTIQG
ncbi:MAG: hypothetical protein JWP63_5172 [Candidatus Solibacter sp.]|nr:hypothetical protein [Candidatus Solibacter sp.]